MFQENHLSIADRIIAVTDTLQQEPADEIRRQLLALVNEMIDTDFNALVQLLYRVDVDEEKLKQLLKMHTGSDSASVIADLIIRRQLQKIDLKKTMSDGKKPCPDGSW